MIKKLGGALTEILAAFKLGKSIIQKYLTWFKTLHNLTLSRVSIEQFQFIFLFFFLTNSTFSNRQANFFTGKLF